MSEKIIGIKNVDFTPAGGEPIKGFNLFVTETNADDKNLFGVIASKHWVKPETMASTMQTAGLTSYRDAIGREITIVYNKYGKLDRFTIHPPVNMAEAANAAGAAATKPSKGIDDVPFGKKA